MAQKFKTDRGMKFKRSAYLINDSKNPTDWKVRVEETPGNITVKQLGRAAAALSPKGFRGRKLKGVSTSKIASAKRKLVALYRSKGVGKDDIPKYLFEEDTMSDIAMSEEQAASLIERITERVKEVFSQSQTAPNESPPETNKLTEELETLRTELGEKLTEKEDQITVLEQAKAEAEQRVREFEAKLAKEEHARRLVEFTDKAEGLQIPVKAEEFGELLMYFHDADDSDDKTRYAQLFAIIEAIGNAEKTAALFNEAGTDAQGATVSDRFEGLVQKRMKEFNENRATAAAKVLELNPGLYAEYDAASTVSAQVGSGGGSRILEV